MSLRFRSEVWFDVAALVALWIVILVIPQGLLEYQNISLLTILKIVALIATLEAIAFFAQNFLGVHAGTLIQGLVGGFISSTMTFVIFTQNSKHANLPTSTVSRALLLSTIGMLVECVLIVNTIVPNSTHILLRPLLVQIMLILLFVAATGIGKRNAPVKRDEDFKELALKEPINWKKVGSFAVLILGLILLMRILSSTLALPTSWSAFLLSLFEAHGVLTAALSENLTAEISYLLDIVLVIQLGNVISKCFLVIKGKNAKIRRPIIATLSISLLLSWLSTMI